VRDTRNM